MSHPVTITPPCPITGLAALTKVIIALEDNVVPANLHFVSPNTDIAGLLDGRLKVCSEATPLTGNLVAINSFGFGGSNVHAVLKAPDMVSYYPMLSTS